MPDRPPKIYSFLRLFFYALASVALIYLFTISPIDGYIATIKHSSAEEGSMAEQIQQLAKNIDTPAIDAKIDRVWKAIPGYNGLQVDQEQSLQIARQLGKVNLESLVINELEPEVNLEDLPPHPIYRGNPHKPMVSFMINVAWGTEYVAQMMSILEQYQVKATFFLDGSWLSQNEEMAKEIVAAGHEIGNHAYSHPDLRKMSRAAILEEIEKTNQLIQKLETRAYLFAPPSGAFDDRVVQIANQQHMKTILWTLDTIDWKKPPASTIIERIVPHLENGSLILMHPTQSTVEALPRLIEGAFSKELAVGTVSDTISPQRTFSIVRLEDL